MLNSISSSKFIELYKHQHNPVFKILSSPQKISLGLLVITPPSSSSLCCARIHIAAA